MNSISTTKRVLAVLAVTTALCADQAVMASPAARPQAVEIAQLASRLVARLAQNFQRSLPAMIREPARAHHRPAEQVAFCAAMDTPPLLHEPLSPLHLRLPPPVL